jgi:hypothetical protein
VNINASSQYVGFAQPSHSAYTLKHGEGVVISATSTVGGKVGISTLVVVCVVVSVVVSVDVTSIGAVDGTGSVGHKSHENMQLLCMYSNVQYPLKAHPSHSALVSKSTHCGVPAAVVVGVVVNVLVSRTSVVVVVLVSGTSVVVEVVSREATN